MVRGVDSRSLLLFGAVVLMTFLMAMALTAIPPFIALVVVIGIAIFIACFFSTEIALYILIFSMLLGPEFGTRQTGGRGFTLRVDDLLLAIIGFSWFARTAIHKELGLFLRTKLNRPILYYILACVFSTALGMLLRQVEVKTGFFFVLKYVEYFIVYFMVVNHIQERRQVQYFLGAMMLTCFLVSLVSLAQIPKGERLTAPFEGKEGEPNTLGGYMVLMLSVMLGLLLTRESLSAFRYKVALAFSSFLAFVVVLFTGSRGSWLAVGPMTLSFLFLSERKALVALALAVAVIIGPFTIPDAVKERFYFTFRQERTSFYQAKVAGFTLDTSTSARLASWGEALRVFTRRPLLGYGITGWKFLDSQYFRTLVECGAVGFATLLGLLIGLLREVWRVYNQVEDSFFKGLSLGFFVGIIAMMAHAIGANTFIVVRIMEPFWFLAGMVMMLPALEGKEIPEEEIE